MSRLAYLRSELLSDALLGGAARLLGNGDAANFCGVGRLSTVSGQDSDGWVRVCFEAWLHGREWLLVCCATDVGRMHQISEQVHTDWV